MCALMTSGKCCLYRLPNLTVAAIENLRQFQATLYAAQEAIDPRHDGIWALLQRQWSVLTQTTVNIVQHNLQMTHTIQVLHSQNATFDSVLRRLASRVTVLSRAVSAGNSTPASSVPDAEVDIGDGLDSSARFAPASGRLRTYSPSEVRRACPIKSHYGTKLCGNYLGTCHSHNKLIPTELLLQEHRHLVRHGLHNLSDVVAARMVGEDSSLSALLDIDFVPVDPTILDHSKAYSCRYLSRVLPPPSVRVFPPKLRASVLSEDALLPKPATPAPVLSTARSRPRTHRSAPRPFQREVPPITASSAPITNDSSDDNKPLAPRKKRRRKISKSSPVPFSHTASTSEPVASQSEGEPTVAQVVKDFLASSRVRTPPSSPEPKH